MPPPSIARTRTAAPTPRLDAAADAAERPRTLTHCVKVVLGSRACATTLPPSAPASSSSTAAWARRSRSSTSRPRTTAGWPASATRRSCSTAPTSSRASTRSMVEAGAEVVETDTFQASRLKLEEWGLAEHTLEINRKAAEIARKAVGEDRFVAGSIGPTGHLPASDDPTLGKIRFRELVDVFDEQARGLLEGGADLLIIETAQDILEVKAAIFGAREAFKRDRPQRADPELGLAAAQRRQDAARHRHRRRADDARGAEGRRHRPQLLDRPRGHARRDPLPRRALAACRSTASRTPACRCRAPTARRSSPRSPSRWPTRSASSSSATASRSSAAAAARRPTHIAAIAERCAGLPIGERARAAPAARELDDRRDAAGPGAGADARRRARQLAGLAQGQGAAAGRRLRRPRPDRRGPGRGRRPRARPLRRADRAHRRGRADARASPSASR